MAKMSLEYQYKSRLVLSTISIKLNAAHMPLFDKVCS